MARCVKCGREAVEPVWAVYADPAFKNKQQRPFALHEECFNDGEPVTPREWVPDASVAGRTVVARADVGTDNPTALVEGDEFKRYQRADAPEEA